MKKMKKKKSIRQRKEKKKKNKKNERRSFDEKRRSGRIRHKVWTSETLKMKRTRIVDISESEEEKPVEKKLK